MIVTPYFGAKWMRNIKPIAHRLGSTEGAEIAEAALVLPFLFMFLLGIIWFGRAFNIYGTITQAAQQGAIIAARSSCADCGNAPAMDSTVYNTIAAVMQASSLDPTQISATSNPSPVSCVNPPTLATCTTTHNVTICRQALLDSPVSATLPQQCGVVVCFQYPFQFFLPFTSLNMQRIIMSAQAQSKMEN
jgi:Flp pilus assembly protein TadG